LPRVAPLKQADRMTIAWSYVRRSARRGLVVALVIAAPAACGDDDKQSDQGSRPPTGRSVEVVDYRASPETGAPKTQVIAQDNRFVPENIRISAGQTVRWTNQGRNPHDLVGTGSAAAYETDFGVDSEAFAPRGGTYEYEFEKPGTYLYYCSLHGTENQGMVGAVIVGDEKWSPPKVRTVAEKKTGTLNVPDDYKTIQEAVDNADNGALVLIESGVYHEAVIVNSPEIVIRGVDRNTTILDGDLERDNGIHVFADGVAIENLTARRYRTNGFFWDGVNGYRASYLTAYNNGDYGIYAFASVSGQFDHSYASGSPDSSFYVGQCNPCKALITDVVAEYSELGYSGTNGSDVTIVNSIFRKNRIGIVPNSQDVEELPPVEYNTIVGNLVYANDNLEAATAENALYDALVASGIAMTGTVNSLVARNRVYDHSWFGIVLAPFPSDPNFYKVVRTSVRDNVVESSGHADLALVFTAVEDGNCFAGNTFTTSAPTEIERRLPCSGPQMSDLTPGAVPPDQLLSRDEPEGKPYYEQPVPPKQLNMPRAKSAKAVPATPDVVPVRIDIDAIRVPDRP
jgi:plastocyanin